MGLLLVATRMEYVNLVLPVNIKIKQVKRNVFIVHMGKQLLQQVNKHVLPLNHVLHCVENKASRVILVIRIVRPYKHQTVPVIQIVLTRIIYAKNVTSENMES